MATIAIRTNEIPVAHVTALGQTFLSAVNAFYEDPQNALRFEEWKKQRTENNKEEK